MTSHLDHPPVRRPEEQVDARVAPCGHGAHAAGRCGADAATPPASASAPGKGEGLYDPAYEKDACGVGFVAHIKGERSHEIVTDAIEMLMRMDHRGACGCDANSGDGAGILTALPHALLGKAAKHDMEVELPEPGAYAAGNVFLPRDPAQRERCKRIVERIVAEQGQRLLGWRKLPVDANRADVGPTARSTEPWIEQLFVGAASPPPSSREEQRDAGEAFERQLYLIRKRASHAIRGRDWTSAATPEPSGGQSTRPSEGGAMPQAKWFYICSLSTKVIVYKGQLTAGQVLPFYPDLQDPEYVSHLAMVHSRFSTNTFPSWDRAQPCRFMSHNGEINTLRGNINWMFAREGLMRSDLFGEELSKLYPIVEPDCSDSGTFDNVLELLLMSGRSLPEAVMMMIPEAWENHEAMPADRRAFYEFHANLMEPWDGPASISFTDGKTIGACLDRNGLRPSRYYVTDDDRVIMASEVGVLDVDPARVRTKGRLQPGRMFLVNFEEGRIVPDEQIKADIAGRRPYQQWIERQRLELADLDSAKPLAGRSSVARTSGPTTGRTPVPPNAGQAPPLNEMQALGYTVEHLNMVMLPMVQQSKEATGSMGNDAAPAVLSDKPRLLYDYFKQLFAQVTNPPIDPIREEIIMSLETYIGPEANLLVTEEGQCRRLHLPHPILSDAQTAAIKATAEPGSGELDGWRAKVIDITYPRPDDERTCPNRMLEALERICNEASRAIAEGDQLIVLSDRAMGPDRVALSSLLAVGAVHHHLVRGHERTKIGIVVESGEAREVHHFCLLAGYGADAINPYLAYQALRWMRDEGVIDRTTAPEEVIEHYVKAIRKGMVKVMSKMGISTLFSYKGAQIFEALGLKSAVIDRCFVGTASRLQGAGFDVLAREALRRHALGYPRHGGAGGDGQLPNPGEYHWRADGEQHAFNPASISQLQMAARTNSTTAYDNYAKRCNDFARQRCTLRGLFKIRNESPPSPREELGEGVGDHQNGAASLQAQGRQPPPPPNPLAGGEGVGGGIPLEEVEPAAEIVKRFRTGAMSFGSLSQEAHETLALAMNRIGGMSNSGEGGEDPLRFRVLNNPDGSVRSKRSAIKQVASGRFGVTSSYLSNASTLQIKIAQGAKPGEGGQLPGYKVSGQIAKVRYSTPGVSLISPPPHHDIYSIEDLAQLIFDLKNANPRATVSVKLVAEVGVGTVAAGVAKAFADHILISGQDGGTGASPLTSIKHAGLPWELGVAETHQTLVRNDLRERVRLETDGGMKTGRDIVIAALLGAEEYGFSTAPLVTMGCIMMRKCHLNTCPVGVTTQDPVLRKKFTGQPEHVVNYLFLVAEEVRRHMAAMGIARWDDLVGRVDLLEAGRAIRHWKADGLDLTPILTPARKKRPDAKVIKCVQQAHRLDTAIDHQLIERAAPAIERGEKVRIDLPVHNVNRAVGTMLSHRISLAHGQEGLAEDSVHIKLRGSAGQSLGAWLAHGVNIELEGDANDYVGKGLSGGKLVMYPPRASPPSFKAEENILIGNVALYGATGGYAFFRGLAAERFAVRNSGAHAVVEGVGDHGCEYMTGGRVVILGATGRNFAAGMSGGIAYVWDKDDRFRALCNPGMVDLEAVEAAEDVEELRGLIEMHHEATGSTVAGGVLDDWDEARGRFIKVMPIDYRRVLEQRKQVEVEEALGDVGHG